MSKPAVVIVPGSWQKPVVWDGFRATLEKAGYPAVVHLALPTVGGTELPLAGLEDDVAVVRRTLESLVTEQGKEVVMLCHSSGGVVGSNAVEGFDLESRQAAGKKGGVIRVVFLSAFMLPKGQSLLGMLGGTPLPWMIIEGDRVRGDPNMFPQIGFNDMSLSEQTKWAQETTHTSAALFATSSGYEPWASGVPCSYIFCTDDNALPLSYQQGMAQQLGPEPRTATIKSGHCPFLSTPEELLKALESVY